MKIRLIQTLIIGSLIAGNAGLALSFYNLNTPAAAVPAFGSFNPTGGGTYLLQSSVSSTQNTITLTSFTEPGSGIPYTMSYINTDIIYGTIAPSSGNSEFISATGITQNGNGTATLTGVVRGESRTPGTGGCVASSTLAHAYPGQTQFVLSNSPCFYSEFAVRRNAQSITGRWNFTLAPTSVTPTSTAQLTTKGYVDSLVVSGAPNADVSTKGIVQIGTALQAASSTATGSTGAVTVIPTSVATDTPSVVCSSAPCAVFTKFGGMTISQLFLDIFSTINSWTKLQTFTLGFTSNGPNTITATSTNSGVAVGFNTVSSMIASTTITGNASPQPVYVATSTGAVLLSDADAPLAELFQGFAVTSATNGNAVLVQTSGIVPGFSGLTAGRDYYVQNAVGTIGTSVGSAEIYVGRAISTTQILIDKGRDWQYLGSQSITTSADTVINQPLARFGVIAVDASAGTDCDGEGDLTISAVGKTTGIFKEQSTIPSSNGSCESHYTWTATSSIRNTVSGAGGGGPVTQVATIYYYR